MVDIKRAFAVRYGLSLDDNIGIFHGTDDPTSVFQGSLDVAPVGSLYIRYDNGSPYDQTTTRIYQRSGSGDYDWQKLSTETETIFGSFFENVEYLVEESQTGTTWVDLIDHDFTVSTGKYMILWSYSWSYSSSFTGSYRGRIILDDFLGSPTEDPEQYFMFHQQRPRSTSVQQFIGNNGHRTVDLSGSHNLKFAHSSQNAFQTATTRDLSLSIWRVS